MKQHNLIYLAITILILTVVTTPAFSEEGQEPAANTPAEISPAAEGVSQPEEISVYGEVQSVNPALNVVALKYYDYNTDDEKTLEIISNKDTKAEGITNLNDLKQGDWIDAAYSIIDGKNIAKSIKVEEKEKDSPEEI